MIIFQRRADVLERFRLILVKQDTPEFAEVSQWVKGRNWGVLFAEDTPVNQAQLSNAGTEIATLTQQPFQVVRPQVLRVESRQTRIARSSVFRERVRREYERRCAVSGILIATPNLLHEVESAHVVPVSEGGSEDIRNGFTLTQTLHWAFDHGLFGVLPNRTIYIPRKVKLMAENAYLRQFETRSIAEAKTESLRVHGDAFRWHIDNLVRPWD
jgi:putative restriction endonuclease